MKLWGTFFGRAVLRCWPLISIVCLSISIAWCQEEKPNEPVVAAASDEGQQAISTFRVIDSEWTTELVAAEPMVANIVAFSIDNRGQIYVCETFRQEVGVTDNRSHDEIWLDHDLAAQTVEDRIAYHRELLPERGAEYAREDDRVRLLRDSNGDGQIDTATVFANHFHALEDGTAAGVLAVDDGVLLTCIPHLWWLRDRDGDGVADDRVKIHSGFGVRVAFRGHDLHGLIRGPDGRIYFSVGDRGYHVMTREGAVWSNPESGGVFRCEPDGSGLEVFATGLRNPQELAFDQYGNLFTGDNNSDSGDRARWVHVVEGGDSGWRMAYQYLTDRGPFNREKIWHPFHAEQPAFIVPPIANIGDGPSGLAYYPGTGFARGFEDCFFLCDFRGTPGDSGIRTIKLKPAGAFFEVAEQAQPIWQILATDLAFGPDGYLYVSDWVNGWIGEGKGRIYRFGDRAVIDSAACAEVRQLLNGGIQTMDSQELTAHLQHPDQRVRLETQFELAHRHEQKLFSAILFDSHRPLLARLHALWGLGQIARTTKQPQLLESLDSLLSDHEVEIRTSAARLLGDHGICRAELGLICCLEDESSRVRAAAAIGLGKLHSTAAVEPLLAVLAENADRDPVLRHAAVMGLSGAPADFVVGATISHPSVSVRRAAVVSLRRLRSPLVARFLNDDNVLVVEEAARAIHDTPIDASLPELAARFERFPQSVAFTHRALNANYRAGDCAAATRLVEVAIDERFDPLMRREALGMLSNWAKPSSRDRVLGMWRPIAPRSSEPAAGALAKQLAAIINSGDEDLIHMALDSVGSLKIASAAESLEDLFADESNSSFIRARALATLSQLNIPNMKALSLTAITSEHPEIRIEAQRALVAVDPQGAYSAIEGAIDSSDLRERQSALALLATFPSEQGEKLVESTLARMLRGEIASNTRLDVIECAKAWESRSAAIAERIREYRAAASDPVTADFRECLEGGDAEAGRRVFIERMQVYCLRCHRVGELGGAVGPNLSDIGARKDRQYLMESIVDPNRAIAENYETVVIINDLGKSVSGILQAETADFVRLTTAEGNLITIAKSSIDDRRRGKSAMPEDLCQHLSPADVRDLVEFLAQQGPANGESGGADANAAIGNQDDSKEFAPK